MARRSFRRPSGPRRATDWQFAGGLPVAQVSVPSGATRVVNSLAVVGPGSPPGTLIRIRGCIHIELASETAAPVLQMYGIGVGLFDDRAFAVANAGGLPKPNTDIDDEKWMWHHCGFLGIGPDLAAADSVRLESDGTGRKESIDLIIDSKAMRKWDENQTFAVLVENDPIEATATEIEATFFGRLLIKLN